MKLLQHIFPNGHYKIILERRENMDRIRNFVANNGKLPLQPCYQRFRNFILRIPDPMSFDYCDDEHEITIEKLALIIIGKYNTETSPEILLSKRFHGHFSKNKKIMEINNYYKNKYSIEHINDPSKISLSESFDRKSFTGKPILRGPSYNLHGKIRSHYAYTFNYSKNVGRSNSLSSSTILNDC